MILITKQSTMEECRKRKLNQKAGNLFATESEVSGLSSGISGHPNPDYPDSHPEYPDTPPGLSGPMSGVSGYTRDVSHRSHP